MIGFFSNLNSILTGREMEAHSVPASLFFRSGEKNMGIEGMPFDLFISEKHNLSFKVSEHTLQDGSVISDHVHRELQEVTIDGMFSNNSMNRPDVPTDVIEVIWDQTPVSNTALQKLDKLRTLAKKKEPVRLVCSLDIYPKMVITGLSYDRDEKSGSAVRFSVTLREIVTVKLAKSQKSYRFTPDEIKSANDRLIADQKASGTRSADEKDAAELAKLLKVEVFQ